MTFSRPLWLLLTLALPLVVWLWQPAGGRWRARGILAMRVTLLSALILALSGFSISRGNRQLDVVFVLDWSDSLPSEAKAQALAYVQQALARKAPEDRAAAVIFGQDALVEATLSRDTRLQRVASLPRTAHTDLEEALRLALALLPPENARRIVVLTDGAYTTGDPASIAALIRSSGIDLRFVCYPFGQALSPSQCLPPSHGQADAAITALRLPDILHRGETFTLEVALRAQNAPVPGRLEVRDAAGNLLHSREFTARPGNQRLNIPLTAGETPGLLAYTVEFIPRGADFYAENNRLQGYTRIQGAPRVLLVAPPEGSPLPPDGAPRPDEAAALYAALTAAGLDIERALPQELPFDLTRLGEYAAVLLVDVPAGELNRRQMEAVQRYVRDLGGGLVVIGGPTSFGVGGYYRTPLEAALPVDMQIKDEQRRPRMAIVYVLDHSGSMMESSGGFTKLNLAKEAAIRSTNLLMSGDLVGVVAFDDQAAWVAPLQTLENPDDIQAAISRIAGGGGTDIYAGLEAMAAALPQAEASIRHVILLTDGGADPTGIPELIRRLNTQDGITLSAIGVGPDATPNLRAWAALGGGRYYFVPEASRLPGIFTTETALVSRSYLVEETFVPVPAAASPLLPGGALPPLHGYVATEAKRTARVILQTHKDDPLLAVWRYGLGKALVFTSDASGRWGRDWLRWKGYAQFWDAAVRSVLGRVAADGVQTQVSLEGERARLLVSLGGPGAPSDPAAYTLEARIAPPGGGEGLSVPLAQNAPGQFEGVFQPEAPGVYLIRVQGATPGGESIAATSAWAYSYSPEYRPQSGPDRFNRLLNRLAPQNSAALLLRAPGGAFARDIPAPPRRSTPWRGLLALSALLLPAEVALRRLAVGRDDLRRAGARLRRGRPRERPRSPQAERVRALWKVKRPPGEQPPPAGAPSPTPPERAAPQGNASPPETPPDSPPVPRQTAARLLERKRARRRRGD